MSTSSPFYDQQPGPEIREKLNELYATWAEAIGTPIKGDSGWSPLLRIVADGERRVVQLYDWTGGQGAKPTLTGYLGASGLVATAASATDIRGAQGPKGDDGTGVGDMKKSVYDPANSGSVLKADKLSTPRTLSGVAFDGTTNITLPPVGGDLTSQLRPKSFGQLAAGTLQSSLQVEANESGPTNAAYMVFHRPGSFAAGFGLDVDNKFKVGGWSYGSVSYALYHEGNKPSKVDVGLPNVDNVSDINKPVSTAQRTAIDLKVLEDHANLLSNGGLSLGVDEWTFTHATAVDFSAYWGSCALSSGLSGSVTYVATSKLIPCAASTQYTVSGDSLFLGTNLPGTALAYFDFQVFDVNGVKVLDSGETALAGAHDFSDEPARRSVHKFTVATPASAHSMQIRFVASTTSGTAVTAGFRRVKVERGAIVTAWSDEGSLGRVREILDAKAEKNVGLVIGRDLNTVLTPGLYRMNTAVNGPANSGSGYGQLIVSKGSNTVTQIFSNHENGDLFSRSGVGTTDTGPWTWSAWGSLIYARHLKTVSGQSVVGAGNLLVNATDRLVALRNGQIDYSSAALRSESDTGDALIAMHCAGASALTLRHVRGTQGVRVEDATSNLAPIFASAATTAMVDSSQTIVLAAGAAKGYADFSGILIVTDTNNLAGMRMYMCGGGVVTLIASHGTIDYPVTYSSAIAGYAVTNPAATVKTISVFTIRTRTWG